MEKDKWSNLECAIQVWDANNWVSLDDETQVQIFYDRCLVIDNLERVLHKKELVKNLTDDAKYLITTILDTPDDFLKCICDSEGTPKKTRVVAFLSVSGWKRSKINKTFIEISRFIREYYGG